MGYYFDDSQSINAYEGTDPQAIISSLAYRYMGQNLKHGLYYRAYTNNGIVRTTDYRYLVDFNKIFPDSKDKECVWAFTKFYSAGKSSFGWDINCFGPMVVYVNGEVAYKSDIFKERYSETSTRVFMDVEEGWNDIRIQFKKTKAGFGGHGSVSGICTHLCRQRNVTVKRALYLQNLFRTIMCLNLKSV